MKLNVVLEKLELGYNNLTAISLAKLSEILICNNTLRVLSLEGNNFG